VPVAGGIKSLQCGRGGMTFLRIVTHSILLFEHDLRSKRCAFVARENRYPPIGSLPEGMLFRILL